MHATKTKDSDNTKSDSYSASAALISTNGEVKRKEWTEDRI